MRWLLLTLWIMLLAWWGFVLTLRVGEVPLYEQINWTVR